MYDYMRALEDRFNSKPSQAQRQQLETMRHEVSVQLDKEGRSAGIRTWGLLDPKIRLKS